MALPYVLTLAFVAAAPQQPTALQKAESEVRAFASEEKQASALIAHLRQAVRQADARGRGLGDALARAVALNLEEKRRLPPWQGRPFLLSPEALRRTVIDYEAFKQDAFIRSGVFPKRYFGYFDRSWDTAEHEGTLVRVVRDCTEVINAWLAEQKSPLRVTDQEIAITFIAEGGALLLASPEAAQQRIHPILGVGLDDIVIGVERHPELLARLDTKVGTKLGNIMRRSPPLISFEEAIVGTALMWLYEKQLCETKLQNAKRTPLHQRSPEDQFILASLVYNSGVLFSEERLEMIRGLGTADYLAALSEQNQDRRWPLPLFTAAKGRALLVRGEGYPDQPTSWAAVYHVLQRYGGYVGMQRFTDVFDASGRFR